MAHHSLPVQDGAFVSTENKSFLYYTCLKVWAIYCLTKSRVQWKGLGANFRSGFFFWLWFGLVFFFPALGINFRSCLLVCFDITGLLLIETTSAQLSDLIDSVVFIKYSAVLLLTSFIALKKPGLLHLVILSWHHPHCHIPYYSGGLLFKDFLPFYAQGDNGNHELSWLCHKGTYLNGLKHF